jgi:hypothetical protein
MNEADQPDDRRAWHRHSFGMNRRALGLNDFRLAVDNQPQRPPHGHHGQRLK